MVPSQPFNPVIQDSPKQFQPKFQLPPLRPHHHSLHTQSLAHLEALFFLGVPVLLAPGKCPPLLSYILPLVLTPIMACQPSASIPTPTPKHSFPFQNLFPPMAVTFSHHQQCAFWGNRGYSCLVCSNIKRDSNEPGLASSHMAIKRERKECTKVFIM